MATQPIVPGNLAPKTPNNPSGGQIPNPVPGSSSPTVTPLGAQQNNPFVPLGGGVTPVGGNGGVVPGGTVPTGATATSGNPTNPGFVAPTIGNGVGTATDSDLQQTYGNGIGGAIGTTLSNLGTATDSAVEATNAESMLNAGKGFDSLKAQQASAGISPNSSSAALEGSDYWSQVNTNLTATDSNMELQQEDTLLSTLMGAGAAHGPDESGFDSFMDVAGPAIQAAGMVAML